MRVTEMSPANVIVPCAFAGEEAGDPLIFPSGVVTV